MTDVGRADRISVGVGAAVRAFLREPIQVAVLLALPLVVIEGYGYAMTAFPEFPFMEMNAETMGRLNGAIYAAAFLSGVMGLFQVISAVQADERLQLCGYSRAELFVTRLATVLAASLIVAAVSLAVLLWRVDVALPAVAFLALAAAALVYGLLGMLVGAVLPRALEGSLVLVFLVDADDFLSSGMVEIDTRLVELFPLYHPHQVFQSAVDGSIATGDALVTGAYILCLLGVVAAVYVRVTGNGGVLRG
ncbi:hypothetical protein [Halapricum salinum]|uniref:hypothetical protein n=1 Tax=Halapricum salinum TaxID=1457250 RepID=UPI0010A425B9|nr:hypothetical protein [Halapricum salinum]